MAGGESVPRYLLCVCVWCVCWVHGSVVVKTWAHNREVASSSPTGGNVV